MENPAQTSTDNGSPKDFATDSFEYPAFLNSVDIPKNPRPFVQTASNFVYACHIFFQKNVVPMSKTMNIPTGKNMMDSHKITHLNPIFPAMPRMSGRMIAAM